MGVDAHAAADVGLDVEAVDAVLVAVFVVLAVADWAAIWRGADDRRRITKPAATVALVALAAFAGDMAGDARAALVVAVVLCLAGDVALLDKSEMRFLLGLAAFAVGHVAYIVTALLVGVSWPRLAAAFPVLAVLLGFQAATRILPAARRRGGTTAARRGRRLLADHLGDGRDRVRDRVMARRRRGRRCSPSATR